MCIVINHFENAHYQIHFSEDVCNIPSTTRTNTFDSSWFISNLIKMKMYTQDALVLLS